MYGIAYRYMPEQFSHDSTIAHAAILKNLRQEKEEIKKEYTI